MRVHLGKCNRTEDPYEYLVPRRLLKKASPTKGLKMNDLTTHKSKYYSYQHNQSKQQVILISSPSIFYDGPLFFRHFDICLVVLPPPFLSRTPPVPMVKGGCDGRKEITASFFTFTELPGLENQEGERFANMMSWTSPMRCCHRKPT